MGYPMPLTEKVTFQSTLEPYNKVQVPKLIRWQFKNGERPGFKGRCKCFRPWDRLAVFYAKMKKDGRIRVPRLALLILQGEKPTLVGYLLEITLKPA